MTRLHLHLLSDSTGETLENIAKAALAQFDGVETIKHFWPMVRSEGHLDRILIDIAQNPGLVLFTLNPEQPDFSIRMRAQRFSPDMYFVNEFADGLHKHDREMFNRLFQ